MMDLNIIVNNVTTKHLRKIILYYMCQLNMKELYMSAIYATLVQPLKLILQDM